MSNLKFKFPIQDNHWLVVTFSTCATLQVKTPDLSETLIVTLQIPLMARCIWYNIMWQSLSVTSGGLWLSPVSSTNNTDRHDLTELLLKVVLNTITLLLTFVIYPLYLCILWKYKGHWTIVLMNTLRIQTKLGNTFLDQQYILDEGLAVIHIFWVKLILCTIKNLCKFIDIMVPWCFYNNKQNQNCIIFNMMKVSIIWQKQKHNLIRPTGYQSMLPDTIWYPPSCI